MQVVVWAPGALRVEGILKVHEFALVRNLIVYRWGIRVATFMSFVLCFLRAKETRTMNFIFAVLM